MKNQDETWCSWFDPRSADYLRPVTFCAGVPVRLIVGGPRMVMQEPADCWPLIVCAFIKDNELTTDLFDPLELEYYRP